MESKDIIYEFKKQIDEIQGDHILKYFFAHKRFSLHPLLSPLCISLGNVNEVSNGYAEEMIRRIVALKGKSENVMEEILSVFSEIFVANHAVNISDSVDGVKYFVDEPGSREGKKNPEFRSIYKGMSYCVEVKKPKLISHANTRNKPMHLPARAAAIKITDKENTTFPRDNPIKDFLISAQSKFEAYIDDYPDDYRFLFIMWDDHMYEPISSILHSYQGLLTEGTFFRDANNNAVKFPLIDGIIIVKHLQNFRSALLERPLNDEIRHSFQYKKKYPLHAFIQNPQGRKVPEEFIDVFDCMPEVLFDRFSDYAITDFVQWTRF